METTCALYLPADRLAEVIAKHPALAVAIVQMQHTRLAQARDRDVNQSAKTVVQRVATVLLRLDAKLGDLRPDGSSLLQVRLRRDDIAGMAGTTLESTSRAMSQMKKDGLIDSGREWVSIIDAQALERIVDGE
ncbi:Crp/Fnr family transcriptional regulator [Corynebacterium casei]|uniref:Transcriptional regulator n=1 Tax=Corynebacterium casei LMG S-19264 TaxID=1285583 RepID=A0ABN4CG45_9CORY|nr:transcriptional regulator [Corynebacterium casei LMG S-19264]